MRIVGVGKFVCDHHISSILANSDYRLAGACIRDAEIDGVGKVLDFAELVAGRRSEVDARPRELVAELFPPAKRVSVAPFVESMR
jgi:hypothetical protein